MPLPTNFQFSQNNLQDYHDCPRRFELRHILRQDWPALQSEPVIEREQHIRMGNRFHEMIHQNLTGVPIEQIEAQVNEPQLQDWWRAFLDYSPIPASISRMHVEFPVSARFVDVRLVAKFDLVTFLAENQALIFDWKTALKRPLRKFLRERIQTRLYPFLLTLALRSPDNQPMDPAQVKMIFWFANFPQEIEQIAYSQAQFDQDKIFFLGLIHQINTTPPGHFLMTQNEKICTYCVYRSLCNRGVGAGTWNEMQEIGDATSTDVTINFEQIAEIEF